MPGDTRSSPERPKAACQGLKQESSSIFGLLGGPVLQSLPIGVVIFDPELRVIEANSRAAGMVEPADRIDTSLAKGTDEATQTAWTDQLRAVVTTGKTATFENLNYRLHEQKRLLRIVCAPLRDPAGTAILGGAAMIEDMTERLNIHNRLAEAERLAAVGRLASKVAHELNNPMDGILRYINLAIRTMEHKKLEKPKQYLAQCRQGLMRMVQIVSELLEFSRSTYASCERAPIEQIIEDAVKTMEPRAEAMNIRIVRDYAPNIPEVRSGSLFQVFMNLAKNALDAMPGGGELRITTRLEGDSTAVVEFRDTGPGFEPADAEAIFQPFFTTKQTGKGTGLGLAICRDIIEGYHGRITADNCPNGGCAFTVCLPVGR
ncbi:MAG: PAS domain-containing protein [Phycisphaerales bacterium]|nr:MAG: PAS domain-containing protein [Phycisphaerales bacterium]